MAIDFKSVGDMTWKLLWQITISPKLKTENMAHFDEKNIESMNSYWSRSGFVVLLTAQLPVSDHWGAVWGSASVGGAARQRYWYTAGCPNLLVTQKPPSTDSSSHELRQRHSLYFSLNEEREWMFIFSLLKITG